MNMSSLATILPLVALVAIMYFLLIRPQKKREKQVTAMRNAIKVGDKVVTIGGIRGKIVKTSDEVLTIQVGNEKNKTKFEVMRWSISKVEEPSNAPLTEAADDDEEDEAPKKKAPKRMTKKTDDAEEKEEEKKPAKPKRMKKTETEE